MKKTALSLFGLVFALASCNTPIVTEPMHKVNVIPAQFQGVWASPGACGKESPVTIFIKSNSVDYYESTEDVHDIYVRGNTMSYNATAIGEGETGLVRTSYSTGVGAGPYL